MKKKLVLLALGSMLVLSACGNQTSAQGTESEDTVIETETTVVQENTEKSEEAVKTEEAATETASLTEEEALEAIKNYCIINNPDLESMVNSDEYDIYWEVTTNENNEIV
ncbi:MAG: hypothetical protein K6A23_09930, partial [Butyrivibrio sp.]|nr:hypothetical protein [Butyrivibrio sp.]